MNSTNKIKYTTTIPEIGCKVTNVLFNNRIRSIRASKNVKSISTEDETIIFTIAEKGDNYDLELLLDCDYDGDIIKFTTTSKKYKCAIRISNSEPIHAVILVPVMSDSMILSISVHAHENLMKIVNSVEVKEIPLGSDDFEIFILNK